MHPAGEEQRQPDRKPRREEWSFQLPVNWLPGEKRRPITGAVSERRTAEKGQDKEDREMSVQGVLQGKGNTVHSMGADRVNDSRAFLRVNQGFPA